MGYSVVKDQTGGISPLVETCGSERFPPNPLRALTRGAPMPHSGQSRFRIRRGEYRPSSKLAGRSASPRTPFAPSLAGPQCPTPVSRVFASDGGNIAPRRNLRVGALPPEPPSRPHSRGPNAPLRSVAFSHQTGGISPLVETCGSERFPPNPLRALTRGAPMPHSGQSRFRIRRGEYRPSSKLAGRSASPRTPFAPSLAGPQCPTPVSRVFASVARASAASETSGEYRARTGDLLDANQALSQLS